MFKVINSSLMKNFF